MVLIGTLDARSLKKLEETLMPSLMFSIVFTNAIGGNGIKDPLCSFGDGTPSSDHVFVKAFPSG
jgi:hypothetical protein